jgi:hypothetical protein
MANTDFDPILISLVREKSPALVAADLIGVQPMTLSDDVLKKFCDTKATQGWPKWEPYHKIKANKWYYYAPASPHPEPWGNFFWIKYGPFPTEEDAWVVMKKHWIRYHGS